jgi:CDGSH-type Zn-finger protein
MPIPDNLPRAPYKITVQKDKIYSWCACGFSQNQPFCDGSHKQKAPELKSVKYLAQADGEIYFCGCRKSKITPLCDGTHNCL